MRKRVSGRPPSRSTARSESRPSTSAAGATSRAWRPRRKSSRWRSRSSVRRRGRIGPRRSRSRGDSASIEMPPSGEGESAAPAPLSIASNILASAAADGATSPPTSTVGPPSAAARRPASSSRAPNESPRCQIHPTSDAGSTLAQAKRSSGGVATISRAPALRQASSQPSANPRKRSSAARDRKPYSRACRAGSRAKRTRQRLIAPMVRQEGEPGLFLRKS